MNRVQSKMVGGRFKNEFNGLRSIWNIHCRTCTIMLIADLDIRTIHASTGEILRNLTIDSASPR